MIESLQKIESALSKHAPTIAPGKRVTCAELIDEARLFVGARLAYLVSQNIDSTCELSARERDGREVSTTLLRYQHWSVVAKTIALLESNAVGWIQSDVPIRLKDRSGRLNTVVDSGSCHG